MSDFTLARESCEEVLDYPVIISEFENDTEQRRLKHANQILGFRIRTPILTYDQLQDYRDFFIGKYGALTSFTFTSPFDYTEYTVRFVPESFKTRYEAGIYQCEFELKVIQNG
ncbi:MAG: hypothetical protein BWY21_01634 [Parcubacteria group bacterium ADurb.Bin216]|nr:MAG: hypothetical protein BWY21_01634 [Parcubacteria group bacterium ADurb.Bin216]